MNDTQKNHIRKAVHYRSVEEIAQELALDEKQINKFLQSGKERFRRYRAGALWGLILLCVFSMGVSLRVKNLRTVLSRSPDEKTYTEQAARIAQKGIGDIKVMVGEYNANSRLWDKPHPARIGYLLPLVAAMKVTGRTESDVGASLSCFFSICSLVLLTVLGLRFFNPWITVTALLFLSVSPVDLAIARRTWQDATLGFVGFLAIYACCEITRNSKKIFWYVLFLVAGGCCLLFKLTALPIPMLCAAWVLWVLAVKQKAYRKSVLFVAACFLSAGISVGILAYLAGGLQPLVQAVTHLSESAKTAVYRLELCSGYWYESFELLWIMDPVNYILFFIGLLGIFLPGGTWRRFFGLRVEQSRTMISGMVFILVIFMAGLAFSFNLRHISVIYGPFYLISALGVWYFVSFLRVTLEDGYYYACVPIFMAAMVVVAIFNQRIFEKVVVRKGPQDLSIGLIRISSGREHDKDWYKKKPLEGEDDGVSSQDPL